VSKAANKRANHAAFLSGAMLQVGEKTRTERLKAFEPPPMKHGFIVKPTNPAWIMALERKVRQYKKRIEDRYWDWHTRYRLALVETILRDGEVNIEETRSKFKEGCPDMGGHRYLNEYRETETIIMRYCYDGGKGLWSEGGFLPTDEGYDATV
jgi:hypothetical protein